MGNIKWLKNLRTAESTSFFIKISHSVCELIYFQKKELPEICELIQRTIRVKKKKFLFFISVVLTIGTKSEEAEENPKFPVAQVLRIYRVLRFRENIKIYKLLGTRVEKALKIQTYFYAYLMSPKLLQIFRFKKHYPNDFKMLLRWSRLSK